MTQETFERIEAGVEAGGVEYLRELASREPSLFMELIGLVLTDDQPDSEYQVCGNREEADGLR